MPLSILVPMVVIGIAGIAILLHVMGKTDGRPVATEADARAAWLRELPEVGIGQVVVSRTGRAALVESTQGLGIVWAMGADTAVRFLDGAQAEAREGLLTIRLPDYAAPRIRLALGDDEAAAWARRVETAQ